MYTANFPKIGSFDSVDSSLMTNCGLNLSMFSLVSLLLALRVFMCLGEGDSPFSVSRENYILESCSVVSLLLYLLIHLVRCFSILYWQLIFVDCRC